MPRYPGQHQRQPHLHARLRRGQAMLPDQEAGGPARQRLQREHGAQGGQDMRGEHGAIGDHRPQRLPHARGRLAGARGSLPSVQDRDEGQCQQACRDQHQSPGCDPDPWRQCREQSEQPAAPDHRQSPPQRGTGGEKGDAAPAMRRRHGEDDQADRGGPDRGLGQAHQHPGGDQRLDRSRQPAGQRRHARPQQRQREQPRQRPAARGQDHRDHRHAMDQGEGRTLDETDCPIAQPQRALDRFNQDGQQETVAHRQHMDQRHQQCDAITLSWRRSRQILPRPVVSAPSHGAALIPGAGMASAVIGRDRRVGKPDADLFGGRGGLQRQDVVPAPFQPARPVLRSDDHRRARPGAMTTHAAQHRKAAPAGMIAPQPRHGEQRLARQREPGSPPAPLARG
ncbi:major facilitator superfamily MFS_1 domain protein [Exiguobacterium sp. S17]|nr:major facilitator superfamily MFS_1 domain protein [Exiguobacterium sp. S17]